MKKNLIIIPLASVALLFTAITSRADHDKDCKAGKHGTVSARTDSSITVGGTTYNTATAKVSREGGATASPTDVKVGDKVCVHAASTDSKNASEVVVLNTDGKGKDYAAAHTDSERGYATMSDVERKAHEKMCKGHHGIITDKSANTITVDGKTYALKINTPVNKQEEALLPKISKVGDRVCFTTAKAADGSQQIVSLMAIDRDADRTRVRDTDKTDDVRIKNNDDVQIKESPTRIEGETPGKRIEVK